MVLVLFVGMVLWNIAVMLVGRIVAASRLSCCTVHTVIVMKFVEMMIMGFQMVFHRSFETCFFADTVDCKHFVGRIVMLIVVGKNSFVVAAAVVGYTMALAADCRKNLWIGRKVEDFVEKMFVHIIENFVSRMIVAFYFRIVT